VMRLASRGEGQQGRRGRLQVAGLNVHTFKRAALPTQCARQ
jgi:hypothetical protein